VAFDEVHKPEEGLFASLTDPADHGGLRMGGTVIGGGANPFPDPFQPMGNAPAELAMST
jgi:hypothetical protein